MVSLEELPPEVRQDIARRMREGSFQVILNSTYGVLVEEDWKRMQKEMEPPKTRHSFTPPPFRRKR